MLNADSVDEQAALSIVSGTNDEINPFEECSKLMHALAADLDGVHIDRGLGCDLESMFMAWTLRRPSCERPFVATDIASLIRS